MGLSLSLLVSAWQEIVKYNFFSLLYDISFSSKTGTVNLRTHSFKRKESEIMTLSNESEKTKNNSSNRLKNHKPQNVMLETNLSFKNLVQDGESFCSKSTVRSTNDLKHKPIPALSLPEPAFFFSSTPKSELDAAATKLQKVYKSYRTRRNLADCAVVVEELWWKALDFAALKRSSVSFFNDDKPETAVSRWARARTRAAKVGKGLSKNDKAQKLALQHWLEAIDPRHRYGHNLHLYYDIWFESESTQPFFYWLDVGDGKEMNLEKCPRIVLTRQCIKYLGPKEREAFEVVVEKGKLIYRESGILVDTIEGSKWIFVLSTTRSLYVGQKKKGSFQHSSILAGAAITAAGRLVAHHGLLEAIWPYSGHYHPTEENFREFLSFLEENHVDLSNVKKCAVDDDYDSFRVTDNEPKSESNNKQSNGGNTTDVEDAVKKTTITSIHQEDNKKVDVANEKAPAFDFAQRLSCKWTTGTGPRIGCVRDYPIELQSRALEQVNLSPRVDLDSYVIMVQFLLQGLAQKSVFHQGFHIWAFLAQELQFLLTESIHQRGMVRWNFLRK